MAKKAKTIDDLNKMYFEAENVDRDLFAEQRSNCLLVAGMHYTNKGSKTWNRIRDSKELNQDTKVRLTKNHIQKITKQYMNNIVSASPNVTIVPRNEREIQDQKAAQLNLSVWQYACDTLNFNLKVISYVKDYIDIGEVCAKVFWNPNGGKFIGYQQAIDPITEQPMLDEAGQMVPDEQKPVFEGKLEIEQVHPFNMFRDPNATSMEDAAWWGIRKMVDVDVLKEMDLPEEVKKKITTSSRDEYMIFDASQNGYSQAKNQTLVKEYYFKACPEYPNGYFFIATKEVILFEGELPFGVWPLLYEGFDPMQTSPRHRSIVKQLRPYQMEINRTASKIAEHQVTSDDKVLIQSGTKISSGGVLPGVRAIQYQGQAPTILQGRTGDQYIPYMEGQVREMYQVANLTDEVEERKLSESNPYGMLFRSVKDQRKFTIYAEKFEGFLKRIAITYLQLAKQYFDDQMLIPMIGKSEYVNIPEFKSTQELQYQIAVKPMSDDINSMFGKSLAINTALQYVGNKMSEDQIGMLMRAMPFANVEESLSDFTLNYDLANNFILAIERGEQPQPSKSDNKEYMLRRLEKRTREPDFRLLDPQIQQYYEQMKIIYQQMLEDEMAALQRAEQGFIPSGGALIKTDLQVEMPNTTGGMKTTRAAFPVEALTWLQKQLDIQGSSQKMLQSQLTQATMAQMANDFNSRQPPTQQQQLDELRQQLSGPAPGQ